MLAVAAAAYSLASPPSRGARVFVRACAGCHTLDGRDTRAPGGDLAIARLTAAEVASFVRTMPVRLTARDVAEVAAYVRAERVRLARKRH